MNESILNYEQVRQVAIDGMMLVGIVLLLAVELPI